MPIYTQETLRTERLPWIEIEDFESFHLNRVMISNGHQMTDGSATGTCRTGAGIRTTRWPSSREIVPTRPKDRIVVLSGEVQVTSEHGRFTLQQARLLRHPRQRCQARELGRIDGRAGAHPGPLGAHGQAEICMFDAREPVRHALPRWRRILDRLPRAFQHRLQRPEVPDRPRPSCSCSARATSTAFEELRRGDAGGRDGDAAGGSQARRSPQP